MKDYANAFNDENWIRPGTYVGEGRNRWSATHVSDAAHLFKLALEKNEAGARYHATAEEGIAFVQIAQAIGQSTKTRALLGWGPVEQGLLDDLAQIDVTENE